MDRGRASGKLNMRNEEERLKEGFRARGKAECGGEARCEAVGRQGAKTIYFVG